MGMHFSDRGHIEEQWDRAKRINASRWLDFYLDAFLKAQAGHVTCRSDFAASWLSAVSRRLLLSP
jgi:hypothetical protein